MTQPRALIVRGGWEGHHPVESTELFIPFLEAHDYDVRIEESPAIYADADAMAGVDLVVQSVTMSEITHEQVMGLHRAVAAGTGFTGWHGGIADAYRSSSDYLQLVGGQFATHPGKEPSELREGSEENNYLSYTVEITDLGRQHPITEGIDDFELTTGAARRPHRHARDDDASGAAVASVAPADHLARDLDPALGRRADRGDDPGA